MSYSSQVWPKIIPQMVQKIGGLLLQNPTVIQTKKKKKNGPEQEPLPERNPAPDRTIANSQGLSVS